MRRVFFASRFEKKLKVFHSRHPEFSSAVEVAIMAIAGDPHAPALKTHRLHGTLSDCFAARISREYRIVFVLERGRVTFIDIGTHFVPPFPSELLTSYPVVLLERAAAPALSGTAKSGETPTRHIHGGRTGGYTSANDACRNICEPHCIGRWGTSSWAYLLRKGCFLSCIDVACIAR